MLVTRRSNTAAGVDDALWNQSNQSILGSTFHSERISRDTRATQITFRFAFFFSKRQACGGSSIMHSWVSAAHFLSTNAIRYGTYAVCDIAETFYEFISHQSNARERRRLSLENAFSSYA